MKQLGLIGRSIGMAAVVAAGVVLAAEAPVAGPVEATCIGRGPGLTRWFDGIAPAEANAAWTLSCWVRVDKVPETYTMIAGFGDGYAIPGAQRFFVNFPNGVRLWTGEADIDAGPRLAPGRWQHLAATADGQVMQLYRDGSPQGKPVAQRLTRAAALVRLGTPSPWLPDRSFSGKVARCLVYDRCLAPADIASLAKADPQLDAVEIPAAPDGLTPDVQLVAPLVAQRRMMAEDVDPVLLSAAPVPLGTTAELPPARKAKVKSKAAVLQPGPDGRQVLASGWELVDATGRNLEAAKVSMPGFDSGAWYNATVPGTVLGTLVEQGVYPDPLHGVNNLAIPDDLARRNWWYRVEFATPDEAAGRLTELIFNGINYHAEVWMNGVRLGEITGAFVRGRFDVSAALKRKGRNALAVRVWGPAHPGRAHEQSLLAGDGPNGGDMCFDGPTFFCTEGWDWIPGIRDRCTGIWQDVALHTTGPVAIGDPQVVTELPQLPDTSRAELTVRTQVHNRTTARQTQVLSGWIGDIRFSKPVELAAGETKEIVFSPAEFPQLGVSKPKLWWPNGYGEPVLHTLVLRIANADGVESDVKSLRFGIRTYSYEFDPHLVVKVNGQRILCKGGNWGMDDALKRVSRDRLEPYVRLHRDANLNMIRNWCGQSTSEALFDLCDEYGVMVWFEFWMTTEGWNVDPLDADLMIDNVDDCVRRFRNHASIALWCGRNEGVPPPRLNDRLGRVLAKQDGTRHYQPNSRNLHLMHSGPWTYIEPVRYFTERAAGFSTELGLHSVPSAEAMRNMLDTADQWPPNAAWAYHDFHVGGNGDVRPYLAAIFNNYGASTGLDDFCRRAQMVNYVSHRAMYEAWNNSMWNPSSGLLIWMSHPSWPSTVWQLYSQDYETNASFFGAKKANEPLHVQFNQASDAVTVVNHRFEPLVQVGVSATVHDLEGRLVWQKAQVIDVPASCSTTAFNVQWPENLAAPIHFLQLRLHDSRGNLLSDNFYWRGASNGNLRLLNRLPVVELAAKVTWEVSDARVVGWLTLTNPAPTVALTTRATLRAPDGRRILPAYASDNYISLLPGETRTITIECTPRDAVPKMQISLDGWNIKPAVVK
jgi:hypothetical protein